MTKKRPNKRPKQIRTLDDKQLVHVEGAGLGGQVRPKTGMAENSD